MNGPSTSGQILRCASGCTAAAPFGKTSRESPGAIACGLPPPLHIDDGVLQCFDSHDPARLRISPGVATRARPGAEARKWLSSNGLAAYISWGLVPAYYKLLGDVTPAQILAHRILWSVIFLLPIFAYRPPLARRRGRAALAADDAHPPGVHHLHHHQLFTFIYAVFRRPRGRIVAGYYINPLVVVLLASSFSSASALRAWQNRQPDLGDDCGRDSHRGVSTSWPAISLILAVSFALYGFLRKTVNARADGGIVHRDDDAPPALGHIDRQSTRPGHGD